MFHENFCYEPIFEEMIKKKKFDQKMFHENVWYEPIFEEIILFP
jgi:hypothetical protein